MLGSGRTRDAGWSTGDIVVRSALVPQARARLATQWRRNTNAERGQPTARRRPCPRLAEAHHGEKAEGAQAALVCGGAQASPAGNTSTAAATIGCAARIGCRGLHRQIGRCHDTGVAPRLLLRLAGGPRRLRAGRVRLGRGLLRPARLPQRVHETQGWPLSLVSAAITVHFLVGAVVGRQPAGAPPALRLPAQSPRPARFALRPAFSDGPSQPSRGTCLPLTCSSGCGWGGDGRRRGQCDRLAVVRAHAPGRARPWPTTAPASAA